MRRIFDGTRYTYYASFNRQCGSKKVNWKIRFVKCDYRVYSYREHQSTNAISKQTEEIATYNVDKEAELEAKDKLLELVMDKLSSIQREVIQQSYLDDEGEFDYISCGEMRISDSTYRREKSGAITLACNCINVRKV
ncbi:ArpU family phage packaging/lysis transcriptional regulator (plasmid) [Paenibacillus polymyxa]|uniref:ArpU family phage packaging/lysis transcriptional regulator n=1 Tax=Paenibacillus polymyxa TaxID=1406 RepID=UPI003B5BDBD9